MPTTLISHNTKKRIINIVWSKDWYTLSPWSHNGVLTKYFDHITEQRENIILKFWYFGPIAVIQGYFNE